MKVFGLESRRNPELDSGSKKRDPEINSGLRSAIDVLKSGGIVVYPTDTAYGLAVDATNEKAVRKLYQLKGREFKKPIHVIPPSELYIGLFARISLQAKMLMIRFWPGPLTIVLPLKAKGKSWHMLSAGTKTIGVRYPDNSMAQALVEALKKPITTTSANISGKRPAYSVDDAKKQFRKKALFYLNGGKLPKKQPSTVVSLINGVKIIRQGPISEKQIKQAIK